MAETLSFPLGTDVGPAPAALCEATLAVENMDCGGCILPVEEALRRVPGVKDVHANLSLRRVTVRFDGARADSDGLIMALDHAGFASAVLPGDGMARFAGSQDLLPRLGVAGFAAMNIMLLSVSVWSGAGGDMDPSVATLFHWVSALIAIPAVAYAGQPFFRSAASALRARRLNMDVPISLGVLLATAMSLFQTTRGSEQVYFDAAVSLLAFLLIGRLLDQHMRQRAASAATNLLGLKVSSASVLQPDGTVKKTGVRDLIPGMRFVSAAGEKLAADGIVVSGESELDESLITGECGPRRVASGDIVYGGTVNLGQALTIETTARDEHSLLSQIIAMMLAAEQQKGRYVRLADRAARLYAPAVHILGLSTFAGWMAAGQGWEQSLTAAIAVLIITCPCALALAVPAVQVAAASRLFKEGVLLKKPDGLERLAEVDTVVFDKTGTLTSAEAAITNLDNIPAHDLMAASAIAMNSRHPYARALVKAARSRGCVPAPAEHVRETAGFGLERQTPAGAERLGSALWTSAPAGQNGSLFFRSAAGEVTAFIFSEQLRPDASEIVAELLRAGCRVELLSGDNADAVARVADEAGIEDRTAEARPDQKIARIEVLQQADRHCLMVGDGLNDSPALAAAHASIAPAGALDISQAAADAVFQGERLRPVIACIAVARAAKRLALQNFAVAVAYNLVFVPLAMAGMVTPLIAAVSMSLSSLTVTLNALRLQSLDTGRIE